MLRSILQERRQTITTTAQEPHESTSSSNSSTNTSTDSTASSHPSEHLEPWHEWIQRATRKVEGFSKSWGIDDWIHLARKRIFNLAGHVSRRDDNRWSTAMLDWLPPRGALFQESGMGRRQSRPNIRWEDRLMEYFSSTSSGIH